MSMLATFSSTASRRLGKTGTYVLFSYGTRFIAVVSLIAVGRFAGVEVRGLFGTANAIAEGAGRVGGGGLPERAARTVSQGQLALLPDLARRSAGWGLFGALVAAVYGYSLAQSTTWLIVAAALGLVGTQRIFWRTIRAAEGAFGRILLSEIIPAALAVGLLLVGLSSKHTAAWFALASMSLAFGLAPLVRFRATEGLRYPLTEGARIREDTGYWLAGFANFVVNRADLLIVAFILGTFEAGLYAAAASLSFVVVQLGTAVGQVALSGQAPGSAAVRRDSLMLFGVSSCLAGVAAVFAAVALERVYGADFAPSVTIALILLIGAPFSAVSALHHQQLILLGAGRPAGTIQALAALGVVAALPVAAETSGLNGVAIATAVVYVARAIASSAWTARAARPDPPELNV